MANSKKRCKQCRKYFEADTMITVTGGNFCTIDHATEWAYRKIPEGEKKRFAERKKALNDNDRSKQLKLTQIACNKYVREYYRGEACISCGRNSGAKMNAGHYRSVGACPELRFELRNIFLQCEHCNSYKSGNIKAYRAALVTRMGEAEVEWLEGPHEPKKYTCEQLIELRRHFKSLTRKLTEKQEC